MILPRVNIYPEVETIEDGEGVSLLAGRQVPRHQVHFVPKRTLLR